MGKVLLAEDVTESNEGILFTFAAEGEMVLKLVLEARQPRSHGWNYTGVVTATARQGVQVGDKITVRLAAEKLYKIVK